MSRACLDTNVLVYSVDEASPEKRESAQALMARLAASALGALSTQVLQEFYVAATRKLAVEPARARGIVRRMRVFEIVQVTPQLIEDGIDCSILNRLSFWDGLIVESARLAGCSMLYSEDLNSGQVIGGVRIINPFAPNQL